MSPIELAAVIRKMEAAGEPPENIKLVVRHHAGSKPAAAPAKPSAASSFGSGILESAGLPGSVAEAQAQGEQMLAHPIDSVLGVLKGATPSGMTQNMVDAVTADATPWLEGTGPAPSIDKVLLAILGQTPLGPAAESVSHVGTALGSGDPNDVARAGGNVTGLALQALLAKGGPKAARAAGVPELATKAGAVSGRAIAATGRGAGSLAGLLENPAVLEALSGPTGRSIAAGVGTALGGGAGAVVGALGGPAVAKLGARGTSSLLRLVERATGKPAAEVAPAIEALAPEAAVSSKATTGAGAAPKATPQAQIQFADLPESVQRLLNDAKRTPAERAIAREAITDARKGDPTRLEHLARQLEADTALPAQPANAASVAPQPQPVDLASLLRSAEPQVPGPAASLEELLRLSIAQAQARKGGIASILPDGQRAMAGGRSGLAVSESAPKLAAPPLTAGSDLTALLLQSLAQAGAR